MTLRRFIRKRISIDRSHLSFPITNNTNHGDLFHLIDPGSIQITSFDFDSTIPVLPEFTHSKRNSSRLELATKEEHHTQMQNK